jgi:hypothetical protein
VNIVSTVPDSKYILYTYPSFVPDTKKDSVGSPAASSGFGKGYTCTTSIFVVVVVDDEALIAGGMSPSGGGITSDTTTTVDFAMTVTNTKRMNIVGI